MSVQRIGQDFFLIFDAKKYICSTYLIFMGYQFNEEKVPAHELGVIGGSVEETLYIILKI